MERSQEIGLESQEITAGNNLPGRHTLASIDGGQLASILAANREQLIRNNMVEKGNSREQAEAEIGVLLTIVERVANVKLEIGSTGGQSRAILALKLNVGGDGN